MAGKSEGVSRFLGSLQFTEQLGKNMPALSRARPDLVRGIEAGDQEAMLEAYRWIVSQGDRVTSPKGVRSLRKVDPESARQVEAWRAGDEEYIPVGEMAAKLDAPAESARQLELPMRSPEDEIRALIPATRSAPAAGEQAGSQSRALIPAPPRGLSVPPQRALTPAQGEIAAQFDRALSTDVDLPRLPSYPSGPGAPVGGGVNASRGLYFADEMMRSQSQRAAADLFSPEQGLRTDDGEYAYDVWLRSQMPESTAGNRARRSRWTYRDGDYIDAVDESLRRQPFVQRGADASAAEPPRRGFNWKPAAAAAAAGGGLYVATQRDDDEPALTSTAGTADLKAETSPPPAVATEEEPPVSEPAAPAMGPRERAHAMIKQLNDMRRAAGGEVPQAKAMMAEINRLLAESNQQRNAPGFDPQPRTDPHNQALRLTQELNDMRRRAGGEVPQAQAMMREIARLNAMGDEMVNNRTAGRRAG